MNEGKLGRPLRSLTRRVLLIPLIIAAWFSGGLCGR
jgi:hypothetical protein